MQPSDSGWPRGRKGGGYPRLHLGAGSESGNELPLSEVGLGWGRLRSTFSPFRGFLAPAELSQLFPGARQRRVCSRQGAEVQPRAVGLSLPSWPLREPGPPEEPRLFQKILEC